jgi:catalase
MRVDGNHGGTLGYEPNSYGEWQEQPEFREPPQSLEGAADHWNHREDTDYYSQPGKLFRLMTPAQQQVCLRTPPVPSAAHRARFSSAISAIALRQIQPTAQGSPKRSAFL